MTKTITTCVLKSTGETMAARFTHRPIGKSRRRRDKLLPLHRLDRWLCR